MQYNILTEPWISVIDSKNTKQQVSLLTLLENGDEYTELSYQVAMFESSVLLFLITFVTDAYVTYYQSLDDDDPEAAAVDKPEILFPSVDDRIDMHIIHEYIKMCENSGVSFDLFDPERPFYQIWDDLSKTEQVSAGELDPSVPTGNNSCFIGFHRDPCYTPAEAFVLMLSRFRYTPNKCGAGGAGNINGEDLMFFFRQGNNVLELIIKNIMRQGRGGNSSGTAQYGIPWYRCMDKVNDKKKFPDDQLGWLNGTTFLRRIYRFIPTENGISTVYARYGLGKKSRGYKTWFDPYQLYILNPSKGTLRRQTSGDAIDLCYNEHLIADALTNESLNANVFSLVKDDVRQTTEDCGFLVYEQTQRRGSIIISDKREHIVIPGVMFEDTNESRAYKQFVQTCINQITRVQRSLLKYLKRSLTETRLYNNASKNADSFVQSILQSSYNVRVRSLFESMILKNAAAYLGANSTDETSDIEMQWKIRMYDLVMSQWKEYTSRFATQTKYRVVFLSKQDALDAEIKKILGIQKDNKENKTKKRKEK